MRLNFTETATWRCRAGIQEECKTGNRFRSDPQRHIAKPKGQEEKTQKEWSQIKEPHERLT